MKSGCMVCMAIVLSAVVSGCAVQEFPNERKVDSAAGARDRVAIASEWLQKGDNERALVHLRKALELDPKSPEAHNLMGVLLERDGDRKGADRHFRRAIALRPSYPQAHNNYGGFLFREKRFRDAAKQFEMAAAEISYELRAQAFEGLGRSALELRDRERAERAFMRALRLNADLPISNLEMADLRYQQDDLAGARNFYQRYLRLTANVPQTARSLWLGIRIERRLGDQNALASYELALKRLYPDSEEYKAWTASQAGGK